MTANLGQTSLRRRRRARDPMQEYDALPAPLRHWLSEAALPWSPWSARKLWTQARQSGLGVDEALDLLSRIEATMLGRDKPRRARPSFLDGNSDGGSGTMA